MPKSHLSKEKRAAILVVDDRKEALKLLRDSLEQSNYEVFTAETGEEALIKLDQYSIDLVVLDLGLPITKMSGMEVCRRIRSERKESRLPIIVLSARGDKNTIVQALDLGADDYVTKPFDEEEFTARVKALLRRSNPTDSTDTILIRGPFVVDQAQKSVQRGGQEVQLKRTEYKLFELFMMHPRQTLPYETIIRRVWNAHDQNADEHRIQVYIHHLRQKIEVDPRQPQFITTVHGVGYRFEVGE